MKTTLKEYKEKKELRNELRRSINEQKYLIRKGLNTQETDKALAYNVEYRDKLDSEYFDKLETVIVEFWIGSRKYADKVVKIGNTYFDQGRKMTKTNGYHSVIEVPAITQRMQNEMTADSYWY